MEFRNLSSRPSGEFAELEDDLRRHGTLLEVLTWVRAQQPPLLIRSTVAQDEYTHDLVIGWREGLFLVYDAT